MNKKPVFSIILVLCAFGAFAQNSVSIFRQDPDRRVITTAVPFLTFAPDSRHAGMGDVGAATSPDANSAFWNAGKLSFVEEDHGFSFSYSPWMARQVPDMWLGYLTGFKKIDEVSAFSFEIRYFNMGSIKLADGNGNLLGDFTPRDLAAGGTYSSKLSEKFSLGISARFIHSNLSGHLATSGGSDSKAGISVGTDIGAYYRTGLNMSSGMGFWSWGAQISNIGPKITYNSAEDLDFLPTNLRIGTALELPINARNVITFALDINKLMVPTPPIYRENPDGTLVIGANGRPEIESGRDPNRPMFSGMLGSFTDAPGGFGEEMQELMISTGIEYVYDDLFSLRGGYFYENPNKGGRRYFTAGVGIKYQRLGLDLSYLIPQVQNHPLAETLRVTLIYGVW
jgi:hypothetical protein